MWPPASRPGRIGGRDRPTAPSPCPSPSRLRTPDAESDSALDPAAPGSAWAPWASARRPRPASGRPPRRRSAASRARPPPWGCAGPATPPSLSAARTAGPSPSRSTDAAASPAAGHRPSAPAAGRRPAPPGPRAAHGCAAVLGTRVMAAVPRSRSPSRCATAPASTAGIMRRMAKGTKVAMTRSAPPASTDEKPDPWVARAGRARDDGARRQAQRGHDDELGEDQGGQRLDQAAAPVRHRGPHQRGQRQGQEEHGHVDGRRPDEQLQPEHERRHGDQQRDEQQHEAGDGRVGRRRHQARW